jgi:hypothetical protein
MARWIALLAMTVLTFPAACAAGVIYRCLTPAGETHYLQVPCAGSMQAAGEHRYTPEPDTAPMEFVQPSASARRDTPRHSKSEGTPRGRSQRVAQSDTCDDVRAQRDAWERQVGLRRTYDDLRRWNDAVARACP